MSKTSGLGDNFYLHGHDLSGDVNQISRIGGGPQLLNYTTIDKSANARIGGQRSGQIQFVSFFDPTGSGPFVAGPAPLPTLPRTDQIGTYARGTVLGNPGGCAVAKQLNFDGNRANTGELTFSVDLESNGYGVEWGIQLTPGLRTDTTATAGTSVDNGAGTTFGAQAYLQVTAFSGSSVDIIVEHSTDNSSFSTLIDFGAQSAIGASRVVVSNTTTVNRYVRASTSTGTFSSVTFNVVFIRNPIAGQVF